MDATAHGIHFWPIRFILSGRGHAMKVAFLHEFFRSCIISELSTSEVDNSSQKNLS